MVYMRTLYLFAVFTLLSLTSSAQGRIGFDVSSRFQDNANLTMNYHGVYQDNLLLSFGLVLGGTGTAFISTDTSALLNGKFCESPFSAINESYIDSSGRYQLQSYETRGRIFGASVGIGLFHPLNENNAIRGHFNTKFGIAQSLIRANYYSFDSHNFQRKAPVSPMYFFSALSLEVYHATKIGSSLAFYWGFKVPYYLQIDKDVFRSTDMDDIHFGFEPEFTAGLTYSIGKCEKPATD